MRRSSFVGRSKVKTKVIGEQIDRPVRASFPWSPHLSRHATEGRPRPARSVSRRAKEFSSLKRQSRKLFSFSVSVLENRYRLGARSGRFHPLRAISRTTFSTALKYTRCKSRHVSLKGLAQGSLNKLSIAKWLERSRAAIDPGPGIDERLSDRSYQSWLKRRLRASSVTASNAAESASRASR